MEFIMSDIPQDPYTSYSNTPSPTLEEVQASISNFQDAMSNYDTTTLITAQVRQKLLTKLLPNALEMDMSVTAKTDPELYSAQTKLYGELRQLLNDMDASAQKHVATKLKQKDQETNEMNAINAAELLKHIKLTGGFPVSDHPRLSEAEVEKAIQEQFKEKGCIVLDTELIVNDCQLPEKRVSDEL